MNFDNFKNDRKTIDAVVRNFEIIGEASRNISDEIKNKYQNVDWKGMIGLNCPWVFWNQLDNYMGDY